MAIPNDELNRIMETGAPLQLRELMGHKIAHQDHAGILADFCRFMHPTADVHLIGTQAAVMTKDDHYIYMLFEGAIMETHVNNKTSRLYKFDSSRLSGEQSIKRKPGKHL